VDFANRGSSVAVCRILTKIIMKKVNGSHESVALNFHTPCCYVDEFTFRLNEGNVKIHTLDRLDSFVDGMADKRLTYAGLIA
jgi:hypothetical protein